MTKCLWGFFRALALGTDPDIKTAKGLASQRTPYAKSLLTINQITNNLKQICKMNKRMIQITDAKVRRFWADSKKFA